MYCLPLPKNARIGFACKQPSAVQKIVIKEDWIGIAILAPTSKV